MANPISKLSLVINGVTTQLDVHDPDALTTEIDSMGTGWVRFKCGIQICYGGVVNANELASGITRFVFPKAFNTTPNVIVTPNISARYIATAIAESTTSWVLSTFAAYGDAIDYTTDALAVSHVAIGTWK